MSEEFDSFDVWSQDVPENACRELFWSEIAGAFAGIPDLNDEQRCFIASEAEYLARLLIASDSTRRLMRVYECRHGDNPMVDVPEAAPEVELRRELRAAFSGAAYRRYELGKRRHDFHTGVE